MSDQTAQNHPAVEATQIDAQNPWLGLASFTEETRQYFHGREDEVGELARRLQRKTLTVLFGQSGLGKTSMLRAGIVPRLAPSGFCPVYVRVDYAADAPTPAEQIKQAIYRATQANGTWTQVGAATDGESLWEFLHHRDDVLRDAGGKTLTPLLIFDQFEEIFTLAQADDAGKKRAAQFLDELADLVENRPPKSLEARMEEDDTLSVAFDFNRTDYRVLIALREDYLAHLEGVKAIMPSITQNRMRLARMTGVQALQAVTVPGGSLVSQEVAESIVRFVAGGSELANAEVEPSLLSLICRELNNTRIAQGKAEISADLLAGSHDAILADFYERAVADQPGSVRKVIEEQLLTEGGYRENLAEERVLKAFADAGAKPDAASSLAALVNRRLLRIEERLDVRRVELTHDVLTGVVKASRDQRLEREARERAEAQLAAQRERDGAIRQALVRARKIAAGCVALSVVAVASAAYGIYSATRAHKAEQEALSTRAVSETSRSEAEKLVVFILDDFYEEMAPIGRIDVMGGLAKKAVDYYAQLPAAARTPDTQRNSAIAGARYAQVMSALGKSDEASKALDAASAAIKTLVDAGDASDATLIAQARVSQVIVSNLNNRGDPAGAIKAGQEALAKLKPLSTRPNAPQAALWAEGQLAGSIGFALRNVNDPEAASPMLQRALDIAKQLGALDLINLPATSSYLRNGWQQASLLSEEAGKRAEATALLLQCVALADKLLALRPGHRQAMGAKASAQSGLAGGANQDLNLAESERHRLANLKTQLDLAALDPGSGTSLNNLRV